MQLTTLLLPLLSTLALTSPTPNPIPSLELDTRTVTGWSVRNFTRNCTDPSICTYKFVIDAGELVPCTVVDIVSPSATYHAWYARNCQETSNWQISWGWDYQNDFTVMTVVHVPVQLEAFFGYNHPNAGLPVASYADVGPNAVQHT